MNNDDIPSISIGSNTTPEERIKGFITALRFTLDNGENRILAIEDYPRIYWFPEVISPDSADYILSGYGVSKVEGTVTRVEQEIIDEVREELYGLNEALKEAGVETALAKWQQGSSEAAKRLHETINRQSNAMFLWECYCIPLRIRRGRVYRVWLSDDIFGEPIIRNIPIADYIRGVCIKMTDDQLAADRMRKNRDRWMVVAIGALLIIGFLAIKMFV